MDKFVLHLMWTTSPVPSVLPSSHRWVGSRRVETIRIYTDVSEYWADV